MHRKELWKRLGDILNLLWIDDREVSNHPIANLLLADLKEIGIEVTLISADEINGERCFRNPGKIWVAKYLRRRQLRNQKLQRFLERTKLKKKNRNRIRVLLAKFNDLDKNLTSYRRRKLGRLYSLMDGIRRVFTDSNEYSKIIFMRPYLIPYVMLKKLSKGGRKAQVIYYSFELYGEQFKRKFSKVIKVFELLLLRSSKIVLITQNEERLNFYTEKGFKGESYIVRNYKKSHSEITSYERNYTETKILCVSSIRNGQKIEKILEWMAEEPSRNVLTLIGEVNSDWKEENLKLIEECIQRGLLEIKDKMPSDQFSILLPLYDVGLISYESSCLNHLYCAPAKLTDYLHAGLPILASKLPSLERYASKFDFIKLFDLDTKQSFFDQLSSLQKFKDEEARARIRRESLSLDWKNEFKKISHLFIDKDYK